MSKRPLERRLLALEAQIHTGYWCILLPHATTEQRDDLLSIAGYGHESRLPPALVKRYAEIHVAIFSQYRDSKLAKGDSSLAPSGDPRIGSGA